MHFVFPEMGREAAELLWLGVGDWCKKLFSAREDGEEAACWEGERGLEEDGPLEDWSGTGDNVD